MDEYYEVGSERFCERHVGDALRRKEGKDGVGLGVARAEKRRTRMVDMGGSGGFGGFGGLGLR